MPDFTSSEIAGLQGIPDPVPPVWPGMARGAETGAIAIGLNADDMLVGADKAQAAKIIKELEKAGSLFRKGDILGGLKVLWSKEAYERMGLLGGKGGKSVEGLGGAAETTGRSPAPYGMHSRGGKLPPEYGIGGKVIRRGPKPSTAIVPYTGGAEILRFPPPKPPALLKRLAGKLKTGTGMAATFILLTGVMHALNKWIAEPREQRTKADLALMLEKMNIEGSTEDIKNQMLLEGVRGRQAGLLNLESPGSATPAALNPPLTSSKVMFGGPAAPSAPSSDEQAMLAAIMSQQM